MNYTNIILNVVIIGLGICILLSLIRAIIGPRISDRVLAVNVIGTKSIILICLLAFILSEEFLIDIALTYALISFLTVVEFVNLYLGIKRNRHNADLNAHHNKEEKC